MLIKLFKDLKKYALVSTLTKEEIETVKKYRPSSLKKQDADGNDVFAVSYVEGRPCVSEHGITFGSVGADDGRAMITGDLPECLPDGVSYGEYVADKVGAALDCIVEFEASIPAEVADIRRKRSALIDEIVEV